MNDLSKAISFEVFATIMRDPKHITDQKSTLGEQPNSVLMTIYEHIAMGKDNGDNDHEPFVTEQDALDALGEYHCMTRQAFIEHYKDFYPNLVSYHDMLDIVDFIVETPFLAYVGLVDDDLSVLFID